VAGTPEWVDLPEDDPRKQAALYDAARHHILRMEAAQEALCEAGKAVAAAADWPSIARDVRQRADYYVARPWLKREAA
jgi:hypothetical protein